MADFVLDDDTKYLCRNHTNVDVPPTFPIKFHCSLIYINVTTCTPVQTPEDIQQIAGICLSADRMWNFLFWFLIAIGTVANSLAMFTIASLPLSTATFYVGLLAFSDLVAVLIKSTSFVMEDNNVYTHFSIEWTIFHMLGDIAVSYSNWILVLICLERFLTVRFPLHKRYYFTIRHAQVSAVVLAVCLITVFNIITWELNNRYQTPEIFHFTNVIMVFLPLASILVFIFLISYQLRKIQFNRSSLNAHTPTHPTRPRLRTQSSSGDDDVINSTCRLTLTRPIKNSLQEIARLENSITKMMLVAAICFAILTIPITILTYMFHYFFLEWRTPFLRALWYLLWKIIILLSFLNLSVNFFLYFLSAKKFRTHLYRVMTPKVLKTKLNKPSPKLDRSVQSCPDVIPLNPIRNSEVDIPRCFIGNGRQSRSPPSPEVESRTGLPDNDWTALTTSVNLRS